MKPKQEQNTKTSSQPLVVVAAVIERRGRWLLAQRPLDKAHGGLWEFPGGKVCARESLAQALARELAEELALESVEVGELLGIETSSLTTSDDVAQELQLHFLSAVTDSAPIALEHMALGWFNPAEAQRLQLAPLDRAFVEGFAQSDPVLK